MIELERTATTFATMETSATVHSLCNQTANMLEELLMLDSGVAGGTNGTIINEHWSDINALAVLSDAMWAKHSNQSNILGSLQDLTNNMNTKRDLLQECRRTQDKLCLDETHCATNITEKCDCIWCAVENATKLIVEKYCDEELTAVVNKSSTEHWYNHSGKLFESYQEAWEAANKNQEECDNLEEICTNTTESSANQSLVCEALEDKFQQAACAHYQQLRLSWDEYSNEYDQNRNEYFAEEFQVRKREADRKLEWDVLKRVVCLLTVLTDPDKVGDGYLNKDNTNNKLADIDTCWNMSVNTSHLDIVYPVLPDKLNVTDHPHPPCTADFHANESLGEPEICQFIAHESSTHTQSESTAFRGYSYHCSCPVNDLPEWPGELRSTRHYQLSVASVPGVTIDTPQAIWQLVNEDSGVSCSGDLGPSRAQQAAGEYADISENYDEVTVDGIAYAYPSNADFCSGWYDGLTAEKWFCCRGGFVLLDSTQTSPDNVVASMEVLPAESSDQSLGAEFALHFATTTDIDCALACGANYATDMQPTESWQFVPRQPNITTTHCWTWGDAENHAGFAFRAGDSATCQIARLETGLYLAQPSGQ